MISTLLVCAMAADEDPRMWLEDVEGEKALEWVKSQNAVSVGELASDDAAHINGEHVRVDGATLS